ncbi:MAG: restriction endonuclease subunit S [Ignavibacteriales bacterium]|nr:restriction endonuclease subunit S [Ignavibacteriales bacterium]
MDITKSTLPKLRFPEFIEHWEHSKLSKIGEIVSGGTPDTSNKNYWDGDIEWFIPTEIKAKYVCNSKTKLTREGLKKSSAKILPIGTLLFCSRATIGDVAINTKECSTNQGFQSVIVNNENSNEFIYYWILNNTKAFLIRANGSTFLEIGKSEMKKIPILIPPKEEQHKIASFLTSVDDKIQQLTKKKELLEKYKKGVMQKLFSQEIRFKDDGNNYSDWEKKKLKDVCEKISDGIHSTPIYCEGGDYYFINGNNLINGKIVINESTKRVSQSEFEKYFTNLHSKTILLSINGTIGNLATYGNEKVILGKSACYINLNKHANKMFYYFYMQTNLVQRFFRSELTGSTIKNLSLNTIKNTEFNIPVAEEQQKIADFLSSIDYKIFLVNKQFDKIKEFNKGLFQQMFV